MSEFTFIDWLKTHMSTDPRLTLAVGDDMAEVLAGDRKLLFAADMLMEGSHFDLSKDSAELVGRKALAVNLSDIAAMAGEPLAFVASVALPKEGGLQLAKALAKGMIDLADEFGIAYAGGDTNSWNGGLVVNVAVLALSPARGAVTRRGARPDDWIFVTGELGGSLAGQHLRFVPRLKEAKILRRDYMLNAMIDLSDGLASDLRHILTQSEVGAVLEAKAIPIAATLAGLDDADQKLVKALCDGEDFELCFTLPAAEGARLLAETPLKGLTRLSKIGEITTGSALSWSDGSPVKGLGFRHIMTSAATDER